MLQLQAKARLQATDEKEMVVKGPVELVFAKREPMKFSSVAKLDHATWTSKGKAIGGTTRGVRVGQYAVTWVADGDIGVAKIYPSPERDGTMKIQPDSQFWEVSTKDRTRQIEGALNDLKALNHPLYEQVKVDGDREMRGFELRKNAAPRVPFGKKRPVGEPGVSHAKVKA